jgi:hypothetical protein
MEFTTFADVATCDFEYFPSIMKTLFHTSVKGRCQTATDKLRASTLANIQILLVESEICMAGSTFGPFDLILPLKLYDSVIFVSGE